jgi:DNA-binding PucR family transcriptional regulator
VIPEFSFQDLRDLVDAAERHAQAWSTRETVTPEAESDAYQHLAHAVGALERLSSAVDALLGPLASEQVAHQTDNADLLSEFFAEVVGDREYGFDPDGGA